MKGIFSEVVCEAIGNDPILDQFDFISPKSFNGSIQDDYVDGTLLSVNPVASALLKKTVFIEGSREKLFSKLEADQAAPLDSTYGSSAVTKNPSYAERLVPWTEKTSNVYRTTQHFDEKERIYDTCLPDIKACFEVDGVTFWQTHDNPKYWLSPYGNVKTDSLGYMLFNAAPLTNRKNLSNNTWTWSFPYDEGYKNVKRLIDNKDVLGGLNFTTTTNWYPKSFVQLKKKKFSTIDVRSFLPLLPGKPQLSDVDFSFRLDITVPNNSLGSYRILIPSDIDLGQKNPDTMQLMTGSLSDADMIKFLYGFGDLNNITYTKYNLNEDEDETLLSASYYTGFELTDWTYGYTTFSSSSYNGSPILLSGSAPTYFNAQFDINNNCLNVRWIAPSGNLGLSDGVVADRYVYGVSGGSTVFVSRSESKMGRAASGTSPLETGWKEYPWILIARQDTSDSMSVDDFGNPETHSFVSSSTYSSYSNDDPLNPSNIVEAATAIYWKDSPSPNRWVLASFLSASTGPAPDTPYSSGIYVYKMPYPKVKGGKTVSTQKVDITASCPWKLSYSRAISAPATDYFYSSFSGMPGFPSSLGTVDYLIDKVDGSDTVFQGTKEIEQQPQVLTDFTSSLFPPGEYQLKFNYVKAGLTGSSNGVDRAFIDNVNIFVYEQTQLTGDFSVQNRIGYSHYPEFRQVIRDSRTSPYFPGADLKSKSKIYKSLTKNILNANPQLLQLSKLSSITLTQQLSKVKTQTSTTPDKDEYLGFGDGNIEDAGEYPFGGTGSSILNPAPNSPKTALTSAGISSLLKSGLNFANTINIGASSTQINTISNQLSSQSTNVILQASILKNVTDLLNGTTTYLDDDSYGGYEFGISPIIRGWKYGIFNGFPVHSHAVFRRNRYGQFRDMLEQRLFTKFIHTDTTSIDNIVRGGAKTKVTKSIIAASIAPIENSFVLAGIGSSMLKKVASNIKLRASSEALKLQEGPVTVKFVKQDAKIDSNGLGTITSVNIDPNLTNSQNLSFEATSTSPFFDSESRNRKNITLSGLIQPEMVLITASPAAITRRDTPSLTRISPNNFSNTVSSNATSDSSLNFSNTVSSNAESENSLTITTRGTPQRQS